MCSQIVKASHPQLSFLFLLKKIGSRLMAVKKSMKTLPCCLSPQTVSPLGQVVGFFLMVYAQWHLILDYSTTKLRQ